MEPEPNCTNFIETAAMSDPVDDMQHYKWYIFYYNPEDARIVVPKRIRLFGWSLNFAHKESYLLLLMILAGIILAINRNGHR